MTGAASPEVAVGTSTEIPSEPRWNSPGVGALASRVTLESRRIRPPGLPSNNGSATTGALPRRVRNNGISRRVAVAGRPAPGGVASVA
jgi:hypothetical protein